jgi:hypothetical protein
MMILQDKRAHILKTYRLFLLQTSLSSLHFHVSFITDFRKEIFPLTFCTHTLPLSKELHVQPIGEYFLFKYKIKQSLSNSAL